MDIVIRGVYKSCKEGQKRAVTAELLHGEIRRDFEHFEPYGYTSQPFEGAELIALCMDGDRSHLIANCITDKRYRPKMQTGEVCIFDDLGRIIHLTREGIKIDGIAHDITIKTSANLTVTAGADVTINCTNASINANSVTSNAPQTTCTGNLTVKGLITGTGGMSVSGGQGIQCSGNIQVQGDVEADGISLKSHTHTEQGDGAETSGPH